MPTDFKADRTQAAWRDFAIGLALFLAAQGVGFILLLVGQRSFQSQFGLAPAALIAAQALFVVLVLSAHATLYRSSRFREVTGTVLSFRGIGALRSCGLGVAVMALMFSVWTLAQMLGGVIERPHPWVGPELFDRRFFPRGYLLAMSFHWIITVPIIEELCFRGWMQRGLGLRFNAAITILTPAWLFAVLHASSYSRTVYLMIPLVLGIVLGLVAERIRSLWPSIILHALWNVTMLAMAARNAPLLWWAPQNALSLIAVMAAVGLSGFLVLRVLRHVDHRAFDVASKPVQEAREAA